MRTAALTKEEEQLGNAVRDAQTLVEAQLAVSLFLERRAESRTRVKPVPLFDPSAPTVSQNRTLTSSETQPSTTPFTRT
jgi:hypothetical protein